MATRNGSLFHYNVNDKEADMKNKKLLKLIDILNDRIDGIVDLLGTSKKMIDQQRLRTDNVWETIHIMEDCTEALEERITVHLSRINDCVISLNGRVGALEIKPIEAETTTNPLSQRWLNGEKEAVDTVKTLADEYGYGNMIAHLKRFWALKLMSSNSHLDYESALEATNVTPYPKDMK